MDKSIIIQQNQDKILRSIDSYSIAHGMKIVAEITRDSNFFIISIHYGHKNNIKRIGFKEFSLLKPADIDQIVEQLLQDIDYQPRPPRATP